jgi:hypothetical protein
MREHQNVGSRPLRFRTHGAATACRQGQEGVVLMALVATLVPLGLLVAGFIMAANGRHNRMQSEVDQERALMAAESGVDLALYSASTAAGLTSGNIITRDLGDGLNCSVVPTFHNVENVYEILSVGSYRGVQRRVVAYFGQQPSAVSLPSALTMMHTFSGSELHVQSSSAINGNDTNMNGTVGPSPAVPGVVVEPPGTVAQLTANIPASDRTKVTGTGGTPSVGTTTTNTDINAVQLQVQNSANLVLTSGGYSNYNFGNGSANSFNMIYRNGSVQFSGNSRGAGVMFITGNLHIEGTFRFDGIIYVLGDVEIHGTSSIYGGIVTGPHSPHFYLEDTSRVFYSTEAVSKATLLLGGKYVAFNGWQEISRH